MEETKKESDNEEKVLDKDKNNLSDIEKEELENNDNTSDIKNKIPVKKIVKKKK